MGSGYTSRNLLLAVFAIGWWISLPAQAAQATVKDSAKNPAQNPIREYWIAAEKT